MMLAIVVRIMGRSAVEIYGQGISATMIRGILHRVGVTAHGIRTHGLPLRRAKGKENGCHVSFLIEISNLSHVEGIDIYISKCAA